MGKSLGIARRIEATAESLPLAPHPHMVLRERQIYSTRREAALRRTREYQGKLLSDADCENIEKSLQADRITPEADRLLKLIEAFDGREHGYKDLVEVLREKNPYAGLPIADGSFQRQLHEEMARFWAEDWLYKFRLRVFKLQMWLFDVRWFYSEHRWAILLIALLLLAIVIWRVVAR